MAPGFYPVKADTSKKPDNGQKGLSCPSEESSATSSSVRPDMKSLGIFNNPTECKQIRNLLESHGIPTDLNTGSFAGRGALLVCINEQYEDALALLKNPEHVVAEPVDVAQFRQAAQTQGLGTIIKGGVAVIMFLLAILGALAAVHFYG